jgi:YegS/Rv2252/BmrU family lipid kinase
MVAQADSKDQVVFIVNPVAGVHSRETFKEVVSNNFEKDEYRIFFTEYPGHANEIAAKKISEGYTHIVAVGGDGTINEVASAAVNTGCHLGIIPQGSGNGLARELQIPLNIKEALSVIKMHRIRTIDAGIANGRYFFCTCGTGFDASVGKEFARDSRRGMLSYVRATIHKYVKYSPKTYSLKIQKRKIVLDAFLITFANSGQYGNNAYIAPNAKIDDGALDLCILRPFPKTKTIMIGMRLFFKNIDQSPYLETMRVKKATLKRKGKKKITLHIDGEPHTFREKLRITVMPSALKVMVPARPRKRIDLSF